MRLEAIALLILLVPARAVAGDYEDGERLLAQKSYRLALKSFERAVAGGNAAAARQVGFMYYRGTGVEQDDARAVEWFTKAAEQGDLQSQINLGQMYENGLSVPRSSEKSARWFRAAADQGHRGSQFRMGEICYLGDGVPVDRAEAAKWWYLAMRPDDEKSASMRNTVGPGLAALSQEERDEGRRRADQWLSSHPPAR